MKKKVIVAFVIALGLVIIAVGFFWWDASEKEYYRPISKNVFLKADDYEIIDTPNGEVVECKKEKFIISVPKEWKVEKDETFDMGVYLLSPEADNNFIKNAKEKGACGMAIQIYNSIKVNPEITTFAEDLRNEINYLKENPRESKEESPKNEVISVDNKLAIKRVYGQDDQVRTIEVEVPIDQTVYHFESGLIMNSKCIDEFNNILATVSVNK